MKDYTLQYKLGNKLHDMIKAEDIIICNISN